MLVAIPILFPLVKPFRASRSGKPFYVHPSTADLGENKASVRLENFTEYPIWHKLWKAAGKFFDRKRQAALDVSPVRSTFARQNGIRPESSEGLQRKL
ncbi:hypothetical protein EVA_09817 [gut metagenome]|uniref:Uncharacterized protein n=1 Tax=gut metagenome TaxID=749906 RepID=J9GQ10_9ZZZZ